MPKKDNGKKPNLDPTLERYYKKRLDDARNTLNSTKDPEQKKGLLWFISEMLRILGGG